MHLLLLPLLFPALINSIAIPDSDTSPVVPELLAGQDDNFILAYSSMSVPTTNAGAFVVPRAEELAGVSIATTTLAGGTQAWVCTPAATPQSHPVPVPVDGPAATAATAAADAAVPLTTVAPAPAVKRCDCAGARGGDKLTTIAPAPAVKRCDCAGAGGGDTRCSCTQCNCTNCSCTRCGGKAKRCNRTRGEGDEVVEVDEGVEDESGEQGEADDKQELLAEFRDFFLGVKGLSTQFTDAEKYRTALVEDLGVDLPTMVTPTPFMTLEKRSLTEGPQPTIVVEGVTYTRAAAETTDRAAEKVKVPVSCVFVISSGGSS